MNAARDAKSCCTRTSSKWLTPLTAPPRFEMRGIRKAFGATVALDGVDLAVAPARSARSSARTAPARAR